MKRITLAEVRQAFESTGLRPVVGVWCEGGEACALGAVLVAHGDAPSVNLDSAWRLNAALDLGLSEAYVRGFTHGFDAFDDDDGTWVFDREQAVSDFDTGWVDGAAIRAVLIKGSAE